MKKCRIWIYLLAALGTASPVNICAESVYSWDLRTDLILGSVSAGASAVSLLIDSAANNRSENVSLQRNSVNAFDRGMMFAYSRPTDIFSDISAYGLALLPVVSLAGNITNGKALAAYGVMYAESLLLVFGTTEIMKNTIHRYRPFCYLGNIPADYTKDYFKSFPSRHTAFAFMSAGFLAATFCAEYPDSPWKIPLGAGAYTLAAAVGAGRVLSGSHFLTDVLAGAAIGSLYGYLIPRLHLRKKQGPVALKPLLNGFTLEYRF